MLGIERTVTGMEIGAEAQYGGTVMTCLTEMVPGPDHITDTGFAEGEPMIVPPVTVHRNVNPGPEGVAVY
jgi:hypothetical protein